MLFLRPLYKTALVILVATHHRLYIIKTGEYSFEQKCAAMLIALIYVYGTYERLQSIAIYVIVMLVHSAIFAHKAVETNLHSKFVEPFATHKIAARFGEEALALTPETRIEEIGCHRAQNSIAQNSRRSLQPNLPEVDELCVIAILYGLRLPGTKPSMEYNKR